MSCSAPTAKPNHAKLVVISVDSLQPTFYRSATSRARTLRALSQKGASADRVDPIYPSITYPVHASLVTGAHPERHGILTNRIYDPEKGPTSNWYWDASAFRVPTLWDEVRARGKSVALLGWPTTVGARVEWVVPEAFPERSFDPKQVWQRTVQVTDSRLLAELPPGPFVSTFQRDEWMTKSAIEILNSHDPDLTLLHLAHLDVVQHLQGPGSPAAENALAEVDSLVQKIASELDLSRDCLMVVGDHGFAKIHSMIRLNSLFKEKGWYHSESDWKVIAAPRGAQASIYLRKPDAKLKREVLKALQEESQGRYRILEDPAILRGFPGAITAIEPEIGFAVSAESAGTLIEKLDEPRGEHGYLPSRPEMATGFIAAGGCADPGVQIGHVGVLDVAATIAQAAGVQLPASEGREFSLRR